MKRAALYLRVSTLDQHPETQGLELRQFARQRGYEIVEESWITASVEPRLGGQPWIDFSKIRIDVVSTRCWFGLVIDSHAVPDISSRCSTT
jgi:hypothetical protein